MMNEADTRDAIPPTDDDEGSSPSEFASFLRGLAVRALDNFAGRIIEKSEGRQPKPIRKIAEHWSDMSLAQKERFFEQMITTAQAVAAAAPAAFAANVQEVREKRAARKATKKRSPATAAKKKAAARPATEKKASTKKGSAKKAAAPAKRKPAAKKSMKKD